MPTPSRLGRLTLGLDAMTCVAHCDAIIGVKRFVARNAKGSNAYDVMYLGAHIGAACVPELTRM